MFKRILILSLLFLAACGDNDASYDRGMFAIIGSGGSSSIDCGEEPSATTEELETQLQNTLHEYHDNIIMMIRRESDGRVFHYTSGPIYHNDSEYILSSTSKPTAMAAILWLINTNNCSLSLDTKASDVIPNWSGSGAQNDITLRHLLSFNSGLTKDRDANNIQCWKASTQQEYANCVAALPGLELKIIPPGGNHYYNTVHLDVAGELARIAGGYPDWKSLFLDFSQNTGLFPQAWWNENFIVAASRDFYSTTTQYMDFLRSIKNGCILPGAEEPYLSQELCEQITTDQIPNNTEPTTTKVWFQEDWHWGYGFWSECESPTYNCDFATSKITTIGIAGQIGIVDRDYGYQFVLSPIWGTDAYKVAHVFRRSITPIIESWASQ